MPATTLRQPGKGKIRLVTDRLRRDIVAGDIPAGSAMPSQEQLASRFQISQASAQVVMTCLAQEGFVVRIPKRGSFVAERRRAETQNQTIEFVRPHSGSNTRDRSDSLLAIEVISREMQRHGWKVHWNHLTEEESTDVEGLVARFRDARGLVAMPRLMLGSELVRRLHMCGVPVVMVSMRETPLHPAPFPVIGWDRVRMARMAAEHLIQRGHRRIAFLYQLGPAVKDDTQPTTQGRFYNGFVDAVLEHRLPIPARWLTGAATADEARQVVTGLLSSQERPEALCIDNGRHAVAALEVARGMGLEVPRDLAVMCCNGGVSAEEAPLPISDVNIDWSDICEKIIEVIGEIQPGFSPDMTELKPPDLIVPKLCIRASC